VAEYEQMLFKARALEDTLHRDNAHASGTGEIPPEERASQRRSHVQSMRQELLQTTSRLRELAEVIRQHDPDFLPHAKTLNAEDIQELAREAQATLALFRVTWAGSFIFLVFPDGNTDVIEVPTFTMEILNALMVKFEDDRPVDGWIMRYYTYQTALATGILPMILQAQQAWLETMEVTLGKLYMQLIQPVHQRLKEKGQANRDESMRLVIVPNRGLAILPLHACWWEEHGQRHYLLGPQSGSALKSSGSLVSRVAWCCGAKQPPRNK
jgi:hypothetical protein